MYCMLACDCLTLLSQSKKSFCTKHFMVDTVLLLIIHRPFFTRLMPTCEFMLYMCCRWNCRAVYEQKWHSMCGTFHVKFLKPNLRDSSGWVVLFCYLFIVMHVPCCPWCEGVTQCAQVYFLWTQLIQPCRLCGCQPAKCSMEAVVSGPPASLWSPVFDPMWAAKCAAPPPSSAPNFSFIHFLNPFVLSLISVFSYDANKPLWIFPVFIQVSYIYALAVFEDYLYATHSDPSKGSSSVELLQIHRFNITAESRSLASLGNARGLRVYHKLCQPKGKEHFLYRLMCKYVLSVDACLWLTFWPTRLKRFFCPFSFHLQSGVMHVIWIYMESRVDAPISAFWVAATSPEPAAVVLATAWTLMGSPVKVSTVYILQWMLASLMKICFWTMEGHFYLVLMKNNVHLRLKDILHDWSFWFWCEIMFHIAAEGASHMHQAYSGSDEKCCWWTQTHLKMIFCYWLVANLMDYYHNEGLSLSAFVSWAEQLLDIV